MSKALRKAIIRCLFLLPIVGPASAQVTVPTGGSLAIPSSGTLNLGCADLNIHGGLTVGAAQINQSANINIGASGNLAGGQGTINLGGNWNNAGTFIPGTSTVIFGDGCSVGPFQLTGNTIFHNLTLRSTNGGAFVIPAGHHITVNGTLTLQGASGLPVQLVSSSGQTAFITLGPGANVVSTDASVAPNVQIGAVSVGPQSIPTLSEYGLFMLALLLTIAAANPRLINKQLKSSHSRGLTRIANQGESRNAK